MIMLKKGKDGLKLDIHRGFVNIEFDIRSFLTYNVFNSKQYYVTGTDGSTTTLDHILCAFTKELSHQMIQKLTEIVNENIYTQEEMEQDLGLHKEQE